MAYLGPQTLHIDISRALHLRDDVGLQDVKFSYVHVLVTFIPLHIYYVTRNFSASGNLLPYLIYLISTYLTYIFLPSKTLSVLSS